MKVVEDVAEEGVEEGGVREEEEKGRKGKKENINRKESA